MAIGSAAIRFNIDFVLDNLGIRNFFEAIVSADDVSVSKPHPDTFLKCAIQLGLEPADCVVFEDAPKGVESAKNAGMDCVAITTLHEPKDFNEVNHVVKWISDYRNLTLL